jgi:hypothetical protein
MKPITAIDYVEFFAGPLGDPQRARDLYSRAQAAPEHTAKIILHQTARLVSLADWMDAAAPSRPALKIFFYVVLAEAVAKLASGFTGKGESRTHVQQFFAKYSSPDTRSQLERSFRRIRNGPHPFMSASQAVDVLYNVRNDVAHRGQYFTFNLLEAGLNATITPYEGESLEAHLSPEDLRRIVVLGAVAAAESLIGSATP